MATATTFERINSKVLIKVERDTFKESYLVDCGANIRTEDRLNGTIIITDRVDPDADNGIKIKASEIIGITFTTLDELLTALATDFFFSVTPIVDLGTFRFIVSGEALNVEKKVDGQWVLLNAFE